MQAAPTLSVDITIPVLNEETGLEENVLELRRFLLEFYRGTLDFRIVIADNGSTDNTPALARGLADQYGEIAWIALAERGVGRALKASWSHSEADLVGYMDLDLATDLVHFTEAYHALAHDDYHLAYGTRLHPESTVRGRSIKREVTSRVFNLMLGTYLGTKFSDGMCGFKFLRRDRLSELLDNGAVSDGWFFSTELLAVAEWRGLHLKELPVTWTDDVSSSRVRIVPLAREYVRAMKVLKTKKVIR